MTSAAEIRVGDALRLLREMPDESVQCVVTSPPYYGLRDYGTGEWDGGDSGCDHLAPPRSNAGEGLAEWSATNARGGAHSAQVAKGRQHTSVCDKCGARRVDRQLGLEATPDEYVARLVEVFREVWRVLRGDGTVWLNIGDSYAANRSYQVSDGKHQTHDFGESNATRVPRGCKPKDLLGIPWMLAFALRADGWYLRSEIVWAKPNPMPESVTDRPTSAHEKLFLLAKSPRYFYDADAIREAHADSNGGANFYASRGRKWERSKDTPDSYGGGGTGLDSHERNPAGRNKRNVWEIATQPFADAHFAVFPPKLVEPCVLAGSSWRACAKCGAPWRRIARTEIDDSRPPARQNIIAPEVTKAGQGTNSAGSSTWAIGLVALPRAGSRAASAIGKSAWRARGSATASGMS